MYNKININSLQSDNNTNIYKTKNAKKNMVEENLTNKEMTNYFQRLRNEALAQKDKKSAEMFYNLENYEILEIKDIGRKSSQLEKHLTNILTASAKIIKNIYNKIQKNTLKTKSIPEKIEILTPTKDFPINSKYLTPKTYARYY